MVEGDSCHRVAREHRKSLVGRRFAASSPNKRFSVGARAIVKSGGVLLRIEVHGKNLFYFFGAHGAAAGSAGEAVVVHIHFGMAGAFAVYRGEEPEASANCRLRLETADGGAQLVGHLSAMTVEHGPPAKFYHAIAAKLGQDPLRDDVNVDAFLSRVAVFGKSKPIGALLMDQTVLAGVGNIYRTETLYEAGIHPLQPANTLTREELLHLWAVIVRQMQEGFKTGSIWGRRAGPCCYGLPKSKCGGKVKFWIMGGRNVYACAKKQRLDAKRKAAAALPKAGTSHIKKVTRQAAVEERKRKSGEGLGVQHMALKDDATRAGALAAKSRVRKRPASSGSSRAATAKRTRTSA